jgi:hypothetical protein
LFATAIFIIAEVKSKVGRRLLVVTIIIIIIRRRFD